MLKNRTSILDERGYNQGFRETTALIKRMERRADWMINEMHLSSSKKILEIGCGTGYVSFYIAKKTNMQILGSDLSEVFIEQAKEKYILPNLSFELLDFNDAATNVNNRFDYIIGNGILHHLYYHLDQALVTMKSLLNPNGRIIFMEPNVYNPYVAAIFEIKALRKWARLEPDEMAFSKSFIKNKLEKFGYSDMRVWYKDFLLPGVPEFLIRPSVIAGNILEKTPLKIISQSILISAAK
jgi:2-polyprenyl-3-methyl-5-hydroxy-6-metoxy-1,4-benzoquinol methylase